MKRAAKQGSIGSGIRPFATCLAAALGCTWSTSGPALEPVWHPIPHPLPALPSNAIPVTNCDDSGPGSLRQASLDAVSGDTIDLTNTGCSVITLTTGSVLFTQTDITLQGPGYGNLAVSGNNQYVPLLHDGSGTLSLNDITIEAGRKYYSSGETSNARGGGIFSYGTVSLDGSEVKYCKVQAAPYYRGYGGGIYAQSVVLNNSYIFDNTASDGGGGIFARYISMTASRISANTTGLWGGGLWARNSLYMKYSTIAGNVAYFYGGGIAGMASVHIENSTISENRSYRGGGLSLADNYGYSFVLLNSTISGNSATETGGAEISLPDILIANSTIAFNSEVHDQVGAGLFIFPVLSVDIESSIVANNAHAGDYDIYGAFGGSHNIIGSSSSAPPPDTLSSDPQLEPLASNGGLNQTHALRDTSPAIDAGNNTQNVTYDQRGLGFSRVIGSQPDIGAYELNPPRRGLIFASGFD